jgi:hypothetical protein
MPLSTISAVLLREGLGKRSRLAPPELRLSGLLCVRPW